MKKLFIFLLLSFFAASVSVLHAQEYSPADVAALISIRDNAPSNSMLKTMWADETQVGIWSGVTWSGTAPKNVLMLNVISMNLTSLDVTGLTSLQTLNCNDNQLSSLNVSGLTKLQTLSCYNNQITSLNVTGLTLLNTLDCNSNLITSLNVTGLSHLTYLYCHNNQLTNLNVSGLTNLFYLFCYNNQLPDLNISGLTRLWYLECGGNKLTNLDATGLSNLRFFYCYDNQLTSLNASGLPSLGYLYCKGNQLTSLNVSGEINLKYLSCYNNKLSSLNLEGLASLLLLDCSFNRLTSLDVTGLTKLVYLFIQRNYIPFSRMPLPNPAVYVNYGYNPQNKIFDEQLICSGTVIDYSSEALINGTATSFTWYKNSQVISGTDQSGKYTATGDGTYYCTMTNATFPGLTLTTNNVTIDNVGPAIACPGTLRMQCSITEVPPYADYAAFVAAGGSATDNGGMGVNTPTFAWEGDTDNGMNCPKTYSRTYRITDLCGNTSTCVQQIIADDQVMPDMGQIHPICIYLTNFGTRALNASDKYNITKDITDNCTANANLSFTFSKVNFDCNNIGKPETIVVTAADFCNNTVLATTTITVLDTIKPIARCQDVTVYLDGFGQAFVVPGQVNKSIVTEPAPEWARFYTGMKGGSYDNCGIKGLSLSRQLFTCNDVGAPVEITFTATDNAGNSGTCKSIITVLDTIAPVITPVEDVSLTVAPGVCYTTINYPEIKVTDKCPVILERTAGLGASGSFPLGTTVETWKASNVGGKAATVTFNVMVNTYNAAPTIATIPDITKNEDDAPFEIPLSGIGYGVDCISQHVTSLDISNSNMALLTVVKVYTAGAATGKLAVKLLPDKNGEATITLTVKDDGGTANGGVDTTVKSFRIKVNPVNDAPVVTPISDQWVNLPNVLTVNVKAAFSDPDEGDALTYKVVKSDGTALPAWMSFNPDVGFLKGVPTTADLGWTEVKVAATDKEGLTAQDLFLIIVTDPALSTLNVTAVSGTTTLTGGFNVLLFVKNGTMYDPVVNNPVFNSGAYTFYNLANGTYLAKAVVTDAAMNPGLMNTYFESAASVTGATPVVFTAATAKSIQVKMVPVTLAAGEYKIMGKVVRKAGTPDLIPQGKDPVSTPAAGVDMVLKQNGVAVANTVTGADGKYSFTGLPAGIYDVFVEVPGYTQDVNQKVTLSAENPVKDKVDFTIWTGTNTFVITNVKSVSDEFVMTLYPNPTTGKVNIDLAGRGIRRVDVTVYNILGEEVFRNHYNAGNRITFDMSGSTSGIYMVKLNAEGRNAVKKLILDRK